VYKTLVIKKLDKSGSNLECRIPQIEVNVWSLVYNISLTSDPLIQIMYTMY